MDRHLDWQGCANVRDLGGFRAFDGNHTKLKAVVRSDNPAYLTSDGWAALHAYGIRTIVALRTLGTDDNEPEDLLIPADVSIQRIFIEDLGDPRFVELCVKTDLWRTPLYFQDMLERWPDRCAAAVSAVAQAGPGGVVISCGRGCDRTGLVTLLLLALVGVSPADIAADWELSVARLRVREPTTRRRCVLC